MAGLSTHVLDTVRGRPAAGVKIELFELIDSKRHQITGTVTNADGRTDAPLLTADEMRIGTYEIVFHVGEYFATAKPPTGPVGFLGAVPVRFTIADPAAHYHVPLLASPWSYTTYRGS